MTIVSIIRRSIVIALLFLFTFFAGYGQTNHPKLQITHLTGNFYIYTTYNFYKGNPVPANGMYLVTKDGAVMIDSPWDTTQFQPLLDSIKLKHNKEVVLCIATHSHEDRTAGLEYLKQKGVKTYTTAATDIISREKGRKRAEFIMTKDTVFTIGRLSFQTYYGGQAHTPDNIVIWFDKEKILYGGCLVKSTEDTSLGNLNDANVKEWTSTIKNIQDKCKNPKYIIPGHNAWKNKRSLSHTLQLIKEYETKTVLFN